MTPLIGSFAGVVLGWAMGLLSVFLVLLVLVQRGRGGGLTGALGGPGGQSAFGTKAGDMFTKITSFTALGWIALCAYTMWLLGAHPATSIAPPPAHVEATPADGRESGMGSLQDLLNQDAPAPGGTLTPAGDQPATDEAPATDEQPATDEAPATDEQPASSDAPAADEAPAADGAEPAAATDEAP